MQKKIKSALISVFYKDGLEPVIETLSQQGITIYSTGGTQQFIESKGYACIPVESLTSYPSILGGRVKTLHPVVFGGILGRRAEPQDMQEMTSYHIPEIDLVIVDLYPFEETLKNTTEEKSIIEKIDIGGPSMIRAAAKNFSDLVVIAAKDDYTTITQLLNEQNGCTTLTQRKQFAAKAFEVVMNYDIAICNYFNAPVFNPFHQKQSLRYGENPHQHASFYGNLSEIFTQLHGKELSYNNLTDVDAAVQLAAEFKDQNEIFFGIIKHTNVCGASLRGSSFDAWKAALAGDPESAFGGVLIATGNIDATTATAINDIFFEVILAPTYNADAFEILSTKKNRIILTINPDYKQYNTIQYKSVLGGSLLQHTDIGNYSDWQEAGGRISTEAEKSDLVFANIICKHLKSNAIALIKNKQLVGKGCGQTSRIDSLRQAIEKAGQFAFDLHESVLASDAFFPFNDCVQIAHNAGIEAFIQPGGSIRDKDSIAYCKENNLAMVITGMRHFKH